MRNEVLINLTPQETRVAVVENGLLQELFIERALRRGLVGNIYKGKVLRVLPGMEAAFVDIGFERSAFLHVSEVPAAREAMVDGKFPNVQNYLRVGQEIVVQVRKDAMGTKGPRLSMRTAVASRYLVLLTDEAVDLDEQDNGEGSGVSTKIESLEERKRLSDLISGFQSEIGGNYIVRTAAEGVDAWALRADMQYLQRLWADISAKVEPTPVGKSIYKELSLEIKILRDIVEEKTQLIKIDSREGFERVKQFATQFLPELTNKLEHYPGQRPIFDLYGIEDEIDKALGDKVPLKSGGYLIIEQTEAMTTVDVNTGGFVGRNNLEETIFKTNLEATEAIARQLKIRNLGGIIILDFIDMLDLQNQAKVLETLHKHLEKDSAKCQVGQISPLGLVEMTRKRTRESLGHVLCEPCPQCEGTGTIKSVESICFEIFREIIREYRQFNEIGGFLILASDAVVDMCTDEYPDYLAELELFINTPIRFQAEPLYLQSTYDVILMNTPKSDAATGSTDDNFNGSSNADAIKPSNTEQVLHTEVEKVGDGFDNC
jgi:ribonuclease G